MMNDLISIIVPVYNVERYISKCLESIVNQTYKNIEVILINDGSKDLSGEICDDYALEFSNIKVIHKTNGGLSDARNCGLDVAMGNYIVFVDSDDVIAQNLVEYLYTLIQKEKADIGICEHVHCFSEEDILFIDETKRTSFNQDQALIELFYQKSFLVSVWGKIYPSSFFKEIRFPVSMLFEDSAIVYKVLDKSKKVVFGNAKLYGYRHRENSITTMQFSEKNYDILTICNQMNSYFEKRDVKLKKAVLSYYTAAVLRIYLNEPRLINLNSRRIECEDFLNRNWKEVLFDINVKRKIKFALLCYIFARPLMPMIYKRVNRWK